jgi:hypothetical protein
VAKDHLARRSGIMTRWAHLPPLAQQVERLGRQHDIAVLASLGLLHPNDLLCTVVAGAQTAAIAEAEQYAHLEAAGDRQQPARLVLAHHQRNLLRLAEVINLGGKVQPPSVARNRNFTPVMMRLRLQMLMPVSAKCSRKRRTSSGVAVSGDRFRNAAKRLQL